MNIPFHKYQGTGNDFIMIDNRTGIITEPDRSQIATWCHRRTGIGADGLILLEIPDQVGFDFKMVYFNSDGNESTMCGNGGRCIARFACDLGITGDYMRFNAIDGPHDAKLSGSLVKLRMKDVQHLYRDLDAWLLNTGSPHFVDFVQGLDAMDVPVLGKKVRNREKYAAQGVNVNFVERTMEGLSVRTYERGVEDETLSCGTGVTAAALAYHSGYLKTPGAFVIPIKTPGGELNVHFTFDTHQYSQVYLEGPALKVFEGTI